MLLDRQHFRGDRRRLRGHVGWCVATTAVLGLSAAFYWHYQRTVPGGPRGGSWQGLLFGSAGSLLMLFCGLFSWRKRHPRRVWLGSAQAWMRAHIWLGLLSVPLILFHSGFRFGGLADQLLMLVLAAVIVSGIVGLVLQQYLPAAIKTGVAAEAMYQQTAEVCRRLRSAADEELAARCGSLFESGASQPGAELLKAFYLEQVRPYLDPVYDRRRPLSSEAQAQAMFEAVRDSIPEPLHEPLDRLEAMCTERRQIHVQERLHRWLQGWLLVHVPLSVALLVLGLNHALWKISY
ncbi:MAG TPA: hypothetical protein VML55_04515 [Planctomycetaceae bacterium]|nr:hypothetical protein [Planctomycetaceae bacterium]